MHVKFVPPNDPIIERLPILTPVFHSLGKRATEVSQRRGCTVLLKQFNQFNLPYTGLVEPAVKIVSPVQNQIFKNRNQSVLFNCTETSASSSGKFSWFRGSTEIDPVGRRDTLHWSSFELTNLSIQDEGEYKCTHDGAVFKSVIVRLAGTYYK